MARLSRLAIGNYLHYVVQSGHNRSAIFVDDADRMVLAGILDASSQRFGVAVHAWLWLPSSIHLLVTPSTSEGLPRMMQALGRDYVRYFNTRHGRTGTLWAGRYRCAVLEAQVYCLPCMVFMDLLPVRNGLSTSAAEHAWSSHCQLAGLNPIVFLGGMAPHSSYWQLGNTPFAREAEYGRLVEQVFGQKHFIDLADAANGGWALGSRTFASEVQKLTDRRVSKAHPGRPPKRSVKPDPGSA